MSSKFKNFHQKLFKRLSKATAKHKGEGKNRTKTIFFSILSSNPLDFNIPLKIEPRPIKTAVQEIQLDKK